MLEDKVAFLLQKYLGNYVRGLSKEALKISVWRGDVELTNMQLRPEALNALKLPVKVKSGFLGSIKLKVPWSRLGQEPVLVYLDRIFLLVEPATKVEGCTDDFVQEAKRSRVREMETKLLGSKPEQEAEENTSWLGSLINTIIGNIKVSITNIHIRYEDTESNPGHPFAAGITLEKLASVTIDDNGNEIFITGGALEHIQKSIALERLAIYFDSDIKPWKIDKPWEELLPSQWSEIFEPGIKAKDSEDGNRCFQQHSYLLHPVRGYAKYTKLGYKDLRSADQPAQKALINLDDVTLSLSQEEYRDILKLAENITAFNRRLKYAHYRPLVGIHEDAKSWWQYACKVLTEEQKKARGHVSWEQVLQYARLRKRYVSRYVSCLQADPEQTTIDDDKEIQEIDRELEAEVILQWRMLAHNFVKQISGNDILRKRKPAQKSWSLFGWGAQSGKSNRENETKNLSEEEWQQINQLIGYKEDIESPFFPSQGQLNMLHTLLEVHMQHNASKLTIDGHNITELSSEGFHCFVKLYPETKIFDLKLQSYQLNAPEGLLLESATEDEDESLKATFSYKPFDRQVDWSLTAKASPCYMTYLKDTVNQITSFFESSSAVSQTVALETAAAVQMTLNQFRRSAQEQLSKALEDRSRFSLNMDIAAPKITIPTEFFPDGSRETKLLIDLGSFTLNTEGAKESESSEESEIYMHFKLGLKDISAFLVDGDYDWKGKSHQKSSTKLLQTEVSARLPVLDECGIIISLQQIRVPHPLYPTTRLAVRLPSLGFHFSPARYHRLMQVAKLFQNGTSDSIRPWDPADFDGYLSALSWKGVGYREAVWQYQYAALAGPFLYILESPNASSYKQRISLGGKQVYNVPAESVGDVEHVLAICDAGQFNSNVAEMVNSLILRCDDENSRGNWQRRLQGAIYRASASSAVSLPDEIPSSEDNVTHELLEVDPTKREKVFLTGVLDELKVTFSSSLHGKQNLKNVLLGDEQCLLEFRALGSKVEFAMREHDMSIGAVLESLEIEDALVGKGSPSCQFLVRSFIKNSNKAIGTRKNSLGSEKQNELRKARNNKQFEGSEYFFETSEGLEDSSEHKFQGSRQPSDMASEFFDAECSLANDKLDSEIPKFRRIPGLLPDLEERERSHVLEQTGYLDSFVKAQVILLDKDSPAYTNIDKQVMLSLATLSFYFNRPTILALLNFVNAINIEDMEENSDEEQTDTLTTVIKQENGEKKTTEESTAMLDRKDSIVKGLLGKGKDRVIFSLLLSMARAQFVLNNENGTQLATLYQDNLHADIKIFPSTFGVKASLGNLKISDNSLDDGHPYYWICDMRDPGGSSFVQLEFISFNSEDDDYQGYDYSLVGELSQVQIVYLNRFIQELVGYFMALTPKDSNNAVKLQDRVTNSEKWFTKSEIEGSPALRLDLSLSKPIIIMPRRTDSNDFLKLDVLHVTVQNTFEWLGGDNNEAGAIHLEIISLLVQDVNLTVGVSGQPGESIIQDVSGLSLMIRRSLRDLWHQIPNIEAAIKIEELKAAMSDKEYKIITECAMTNISERPNNTPLLDNVVETSPGHEIEHEISEILDMESGESSAVDSWVTIKVTVDINFVELSLYTGRSRDTPLATMQISGMWLLYKSSSDEESLVMATLQNFSVTDDREGTVQEFRRAIGKADNIEYAPLHWVHTDSQDSVEQRNNTLLSSFDCNPVTTMLILDVKLSKSSQKISFCIQRPQLLVALDFLLAVAEFFVPSITSISSDDNVENPVDMSGGIILEQPVYCQCHDEVTISPTRPLVADDERYDSFIYDGKGGRLRLVNRHGADLAEPSREALLFIGSGKKLQFKNLIIQNGEYLDSCISLGANSNYSASEDDGVFLLEGTNHLSEGTLLETSSKDPSTSSSQHKNSSLDLVIELQAVGPELTFYSTSKGNEVSTIPSEKLLHAEVDMFSRLILKGDNIELNAKALGLTVEASSGVRVVEPFDTVIKFSKVAGKTNIHVAISDMLTNFSFSILQLCIRLQEDILAFLRTTSRKATVVCSQFNRIWADESISFNEKYAFWRPQAPPGFAVLGDCLTPVDEPPSKGVFALNTSFAKVKRPLHFELVWSSSENNNCSDRQQINMSESDIRETDVSQYSKDNSEQSECRVWMPIPPEGYVALGCVVSRGREEPLLSSSLCVSATLVTPCALKDCVFFSYPQLNYENKKHAFWRVDNSVGSFVPRQSETGHPKWKSYDLRNVVFGYNHEYSNPSVQNPAHGSNSKEEVMNLETSEPILSSQRYQNVSQFELVWWNRGKSAKKKLSIWRPIVPPGCFYVGDIAVPGYEPPNVCLALHDFIDGTALRSPLDFQKVGHINKRSGMDSISFWFPQAPPGYVSLGCIASKSTTKPEEINLLRCVRSDLVSGDQFPDNSIWDTTEIKHMREGFSIWTLDNELGTFIVRNGFKRPPKRFGMRLAGQRVSTESDDLVIDAEVRGLSATLFDDFGGLMAPLFNVALTGITFSLHGRLDNLNSTLNLSLMTRSYNEKDGSWEPLIEPVDGFIRYQYDENASGAPSQIRMAFTRDLNINLSVSNVNMLLEALSSWNKLHEVKGSSKTKERNLTTTRKSVLDKETCYIIPQNKLGQDIFLRTFGFDGQPEVNILPPGDVITVKVPASNSISDTHLMGNMRRSLSKRVAIVISDAELPKHEGIGALQYMVAVRIVAQQLMSGEVQPQVQSARTRCMNAEPDSLAGSVRVRWNEVFYFKVDAVEAHMIEIIVTDVEKGVHIGSYSTPLTRAIFLGHKRSTLPSTKEEPDLAWRQLCSTESRNDENKSSAYRGKIRCGMFISSIFTDEMYAKDLSFGTKPGDIQVSPAREGPWTTVNLNCAASAVCWRKGHDSIAREVSVKGSNKYLIIRSLVSVLNQTDFSIELCLFSESSNSQLEYSNDHCQGHEQQISDNFAQDEVFENEKYHPLLGWGSSCPGHLLPSDPGHWSMRDDSSSQDFPEIQLPPSWKWASDWHIDNTSSSSSEGWAYAFDFRHLNWPPSFNPEGPTTFVRRRRWIRTRQHISNDGRHSFSVGILRAGEVTPLPVECLGRAGPKYILKFKPCNLNGVDEYLWSHVFNYRGRHDSDPKHVSMPCISVPLLMETEELVYTPAKEANATTHRNGLWFCMSVKATVIGKDVHLDPIRDWKLVLTAPLTLISFLPVSSEFSVLEKLSGGELSVRYRGVVKSGETIKVYSADLRNPLYFSLIPQGGWQPIHEAALISHPTKELAQYLTLKNSYSSRMVQVILEHNKDGKDTVAKILRIYTPYWLECLRCPPLQLRLIGMDQMRRLISSINTGNGKILEQINQEELQTGCTIISTFDPKSMGLSITLSDSGNLCFSRTMALSPLSDLDGSVDLKAHDGNGHSIRLFVSTKLCPYQSAPTKVICVRPYMTFTNRTGQCLYIKMHNNDEPKSLHASDWRVAYCMVDTEEREKLQVRLDNTNWSYPFSIKEDTISVVMRQEDGTRQFLRAEIRGYEEGSRFLIVFRLGSNNGPFRIENRTNMKLIKHRQSGLDDDAWQLLKPLSTMNFAWEDPYGQHLLDVLVEHASISSILTVDIDKVGDFYPRDGSVTTGICIRVIEVHDIKVVTFYDDKRNPQKIYTVEENAQAANDVESVFQIQTRTQSSTTPLEIILEVGAVGVSIVDQTPKEILYLYLQRVFVSYSTGYTSRLKLLLENLQLDNQLPLTNMPVLLSPEVPGDVQHPVFKLTFTMSNDNVDGTQVYPYIGIRVTENCWRLNVHEPIIWAVMEFYKNIQLDRFSEGSNVTQVDPEIRIELIDISEIRLKFSLEAAPAQRPHGIFGIWTPIINTIGNVLKMQIHFRTVVCRSKFMRKSSVMPAIINRIRRDLIHNPFHLLFGVDVLGMTSSTLASLSKGFAELSTDGQFLQLRTKQGSTRRITGFGDGILQGTEALAQGVAFGVSGVLTKPWTNAREHGIFGFLQGVGTACLGFIVQPVSGILDFVSLTVHGVGASCTRFFEIFGNKSVSNRIRLPRAIRGNGLLEVYDERAALGQMILHLAEASRHFGCTEIFKEPSKFAWSDFYEEHFDLPRRLILLVTNRRVLMVQCLSSNKMLTRPCKIQWDVPWDELLALELVKGDQEKPAHVLLHLRNFKRSECFVRVIKFLVENDQEGTSQATVIYSFIQRLWNTYQSGKKGCDFKMPNIQRHLASSSQGVSDRISVADSFNVVGSKAETSSQCPDSGISETLNQRPLLRPSSKCNRDGSFRMHTVNFQNIWNSEQDSRIRCTLCPELVGQDKQVCSIWRPICPEGYISIGHIAHIGKHPPTISIVYQYNKREFASPIGFDLVWRNCIDDFIRPLSIWIPKAPEGYRSIGCVAVEGYVEPEPSAIFCVHSTIVEETMFEDEPIWTAPGAYPWACYLYQVQSEALHFVALRQKNEDSTWRPCKIVEDREP